jgi:translocation and assembly module TamB
MMRLGLSGKVDQSDIVATEPIDVRWTRAQLVASGAVRVGDGSIEGVWRGDKEKLSVDATLADVPLIALTAMLDQPLAGTLSGKIHMAGAKKNLAGDANLTFAQARFARRSRDPLDGHLTAHLGDGVLQAQLDAQSAAGLKASASAKIPMVAEAAPFRLVPQSGGVLDAEWRVAGPVDGLWTLFGPLDQSLGGQVNGEGRVRFAGGGVTGAGKLALSAGSFEDKLSGVKLRNIASTISFDDQGMTLDHLSATDVNGGSLTGSGRLNGKDDGKLSLSLRNVRLVDRPDARATGNGDLALEWRPTGATLTGRIDLIEAEARGGAGAVTSPAEIDVVEVNRPGPPSRPKAVATSAINAKLDIRVVALGRVFTRTRGLDAEWSMDVRLAGDVNTPLVFGEARLLRGDFNLGGRRFDLDKGEIKFSGAPENAEVDLTATANSQDLTAHVTMTGPVLDPKIELSSEPALPEDEILPQLLFGRSAQDLSALEAAQLAASLASLAGKSAFDIAGAARAAVALDRLEVRQDGVGVLVAGGKYLTREVYVEVSRNALGRTATSVEWQIRPRLFVIPSFLANGDQRLAVRWRQDY